MTWVKGQSGNPSGKPAGTPARLTQAVKDMILESLERLGGADWLVALARHEPAAYASLLGRVIPREISATVEHGPVTLVLQDPRRLDPLPAALPDAQGPVLIADAVVSAPEALQRAESAS